MGNKEAAITGAYKQAIESLREYKSIPDSEKTVEDYNLLESDIYEVFTDLSKRIIGNKKIDALLKEELPDF